MKKTILALIATMNLIACENENGIFTQPENTFIAKGYSNIVETRTSFGTPTENKIPYKWSNGDFIWLGENRSDSITEDSSPNNDENSRQRNIFCPSRNRNFCRPMRKVQSKRPLHVPAVARRQG